MSRRNGNAPKLDHLKLNLSPPRVNNPRVQSPSRSSTASPTSPQSSCVSSELNQDHQDTYIFSNSPDSTAMIVAGCPRCLMYVMLPEKDPRCPKCKSTVLLEVFNETTKTTAPTTTRTQRK
ncbi:hypothetical protein ACH5RR_004513 [Cinchona calisaya]|uniref:GIR1-like zinc ribbon domain-containing protein n=1 Tax=Cinchona calisaya TaxID=153742 RepID=A0ABD3AYP5_9GENT